MAIDFGNIGSSVANAASSAGTAVKNAALWTGRMIKAGSVKFYTGVIKRCWEKAVPFIKNTAQQVWSKLNTPAGAAGSLFVLGTVFFASAQFANKNRVASISLNALACASFAGAAGALVLGITTGMSRAII